MTAPTDEGLNLLRWEMFTAHFPDKDVKSFNQAKEGQAPRWLSYVEDETVMDRLDRGLGPGRWNLNATVADPGKSVALVTLGILWPETGWVYYSDFGYPTNGERGEALKESVSDGIRRVARMAGIARYIYAGEVTATPSRGAAPRQRPPQQPPSGDWAADAAREVDHEAGNADAMCEKHSVSWMGSPFDPSNTRSGRYHKDGEWPDGKTRWCRHPADEAAKKGNR